MPQLGDSNLRCLLVAIDGVIQREYAATQLVVKRLAEADFVKQARACLLDVIAESQELALRRCRELVGMLAIQRSGSERT